MIRKTGLIKLVGSWPPPDLSSPQLLDSAWKDWSRYETFKRYVFQRSCSLVRAYLDSSNFSALFFAYLQDCYQCVYFSSLPTFTSDELEISLPSNDDLWRASTARDWYQIQAMPDSNHRIGLSGVLGTSMRQALVALKEQGPAALTCPINPFSAFILIHIILCDIFTPSLNHPSIGLGSNSPSNPLAIQYALHNWQQIWAISSGGQLQDNRTPFVHDASTFYWLARLAQGAKQNGSLQIRPLSSKPELQERYQTVKAWLNEIKANNTVRNEPQYTPDMAFNRSMSIFSS